MLVFCKNEWSYKGDKGWGFMVHDVCYNNIVLIGKNLKDKWTVDLMSSDKFLKEKD